MPVAHLALSIFDGAALCAGHSLIVEEGRIAGIVPDEEVPGDMKLVDHGACVLMPGFVDLQVNGGGGVMLNDDPTVAALSRIAEAHAALGTTALLPTLITDTPQVTAAVIEAAVVAVSVGVPGIAGLHLEGPHLSAARKGAHDPALIRPMTDADLTQICEAARILPALMVTIAPECVPPEQISAMAEAGAIVSLGHSACDYQTAMEAAEAGARCVTHLFNAMSRMDSRAPGLVGAALSHGDLAAGVIADGVHVHPVTLAAGLRAKRGPARAFLVSDAMAVAGTGLDGFMLNGRQVARRAGRLTLEDGTLAGADLEMAQAMRLIWQLGLGMETALGMATSVPAGVIGQGDRLGLLAPEGAADFVVLTPDFRVASVWRGGARLGG